MSHCLGSSLGGGWETEYIPCGLVVTRAFTVLFGLEPSWSNCNQLVLYLYTGSLSLPDVFSYSQPTNKFSICFKYFKSVICIAVVLKFENNNVGQQTAYLKFSVIWDRVVTLPFEGKSGWGQGHGMGKLCKLMYLLIGCVILYNTHISLPKFTFIFRRLMVLLHLEFLLLLLP